MNQEKRTAILLELVQLFHQSKGLGELAYSDSPLSLEKASQSLAGQIKNFYQHLDFDDEVYFEELAFVPMTRTVELAEGWEGENWLPSFVLFAHTMGDDAVFCDRSQPACPVYGMITGGSHQYQLAPSLFEFLKTYLAIKRMELEKFGGNIYQDDSDFEYQSGYETEVQGLIETGLPQRYQTDFAYFMFG